MLSKIASRKIVTVEKNLNSNIFMKITNKKKIVKRLVTTVHFIVQMSY
jgi:hypothetical protein